MRNGQRRAGCGQQHRRRYYPLVFVSSESTQTIFQVHHDQMKHVRKGCLARPREDIPSDGSRIEGSHKGWNGLQRAFSSGLVMFRALSHDFVLRRNIRVGLTGKYRKPEPFLSSTYGCHHIRLVNHTASLWNALLRRKRPLCTVEPNNLATLPELCQINSNEAFGIVSSENAISFGGLFEIKEEDQNDFDLLDDDAIGPGTDDNTHQVPDGPAHIDPALVAASCLPPPPTSNLSIVDSMVTVSLSRAVPRSVGH